MDLVRKRQTCICLTLTFNRLGFHSSVSLATKQRNGGTEWGERAEKLAPSAQ
jgi:hypothetical protein